MYLHRADDSPCEENLVVGLAHDAWEKLVEVEDGVDEGDVVGHHDGRCLLGSRLSDPANPVKPAHATNTIRHNFEN